jgi:hypothetical protein
VQFALGSVAPYVLHLCEVCDQKKPANEAGKGYVNNNRKRQGR